MRHLLTRFSGAILILLILAPFAQSETENQIIQLALAKSLLLKKMGISLRKAEAVRDQSLDKAGLQFSLTGDVAKQGNTFSDSVYTAGGFQTALPLPLLGGQIGGTAAKGSDGLVYSVSAVQPLLKGALSNSEPLYRKKQALFLYTVATLDHAVSLSSFLADLKSSFRKAYETEESARLYHSAESLATETHKFTLRRFAVGDATVLDTLETLQNLQNVKSSRMKADNDSRYAKRTLELLCGDTKLGGLQMDSTVSIKRTIEECRPDRSPELLREEGMARLLEMDARVQRNWRLPALDAKAVLNGTEPSNGPAWKDYSIGVSLSYPLLGSGNRASARIAESAYQEQKESEKEKAQNWASTVQNLCEDLVYREQALKQAKEQVSVAELRNKLSAEMFAQGAVDLVGRLRAEQDWLQAKMAGIAAEASRAYQTIRLDNLTGRLLSENNIDLKLKAGE